MADCEAGGAVKAQQRLHGNGTGAVRCGSRRVAVRSRPVPSWPSVLRESLSGFQFRFDFVPISFCIATFSLVS